MYEARRSGADDGGRGRGGEVRPGVVPLLDGDAEFEAVRVRGAVRTEYTVQVLVVVYIF